MKTSREDRAKGKGDVAAGDLRDLFRKIFGSDARLYRAPGRVNLIGEHTDYNQGFVMPAAIDLYCWAAIAPRQDRQLKLSSTNFEGSTVIDLDDVPRQRGDWTDYIVGTAVALEKRGHKLQGAEILVHGEVPIGSGLSSSAAIEVSTGYALLDMNGIKVDRTELAVSSREAENEFVGARVGIMDQYIAANGKDGHAILLDCRSLQGSELPIPQDVRLVVCNTGVKHQHAGGEYNARRAQCEEGVQRLSAVLPWIESLRDVTMSQLEQHKALLPEVIYRRCRHVVTENQRALETAEALRNREMTKAGKLMAGSHESLRDDYEVSCAELDAMVEIAQRQPGVIGARMTGGGFGGCTINLVQAEASPAFKDAVATEYEARIKLHPEIYVLHATRGVHAVTNDASETRC